MNSNILKISSGSYCIPKKSWPISYSRLLYKIGQDFFDIQYFTVAVIKCLRSFYRRNLIAVWAAIWITYLVIYISWSWTVFNTISITYGMSHNTVLKISMFIFILKHSLSLLSCISSGNAFYIYILKACPPPR